MEVNIEIKTEPNIDRENSGSHVNRSKYIPSNILQASFKVEKLPVKDDRNVQTLSSNGALAEFNKDNSHEDFADNLSQDIKVEEDPLLLENTPQIELENIYNNDFKVKAFPFLQQNTSQEYLGGNLDENDLNVEDSSWPEGKRKERTSDTNGQPRFKRAKADSDSKSNKKDTNIREQHNSKINFSGVESDIDVSENSDNADYFPSDDEKHAKREKKEKKLKQSLAADSKIKDILTGRIKQMKKKERVKKIGRYSQEDLESGSQGSRKYSKLIMAKTTPAERMKLYRKRRNELDPEFKKNESRRVSTFMRNQRAAMSEQQLDELREKRCVYSKIWREKRKSKKAKSITVDNEAGFKSVKTTKAERMKLYRKRRSESDPEFKKNESRRVSTLRRYQRAAMSEQQLDQLREKNCAYLKKWRENKNNKNAKNIVVDNEQGFKSPQSYGKALKRLRMQLPKTHKKKIEVVKGLAKEVGLELKYHEVNHTERGGVGISD